MKNVADKLRSRPRRWPWITGGVAAAGVIVAAVVVGPSFAANLNSSPTPTPTLTPYVATLTPAELDSVQQGADQQAAKIAADKAAADAAAAQAAADAAKTVHHSSGAGGPVKCPAGSSANSNDGVNDTSCFPTICFGITVPDPAHPECNVAFKP